MSFENLEIIKPILSALESEGYSLPTAIQEQAIPVIFEGKDLLGCAQTGTGKTAAFAIPILQKLSSESTPPKTRKKIRALVLSPTRELAVQIGDSFAVYGQNTKLKNVVVYGGVSQLGQTNKLSKGVDILVATPGRLLDLMNQGFIDLGSIEIFVLDEADRMLDMGFINDIKKIIAKIPKERQSLFFSATMSPEIVRLAETILTNPVKVEIETKTKTVDTITQGIYFVTKSNKKSLLVHLLKQESIESALVFTRTKSGADRVTKLLNTANIKALAIHGNKSQNARQKALDDFKLKKVRVLVATDIAARGLDIEELSHVINYEMPEYSENYIHRIGRTGRAGLSGTALSFCDKEELSYLKEITKLIKMSIPIINDHPFKTDINEDQASDAPVRRPNTRQRSSYSASKKAPGKNGSNTRSSSPGRRSDSSEKRSEFSGSRRQNPEQKNTGGENRNVNNDNRNVGRENRVTGTDSRSAGPAKRNSGYDNRNGSRDNRNAGYQNRKFENKRPGYDNRSSVDKKPPVAAADQNNDIDTGKSVIDNRSTFEIQKSNTDSRNKARFQRNNSNINTSERKISKVWTNHEEFITIGYKKEKKFSNTQGNAPRTNDGTGKPGNKNSSRYGSGYGKKVWSNNDRYGSSNFSKGRKKGTGPASTEDGTGFKKPDENQGNGENNPPKKRFSGSSFNPRWKSK